MAFFLALLMVLPLWGQSVTISKEQLDELTMILQDYERITGKLVASWETSGKRIDALESGFDQYKGKVDDQLIPKALALERKTKTLTIVVIIETILTLLGLGIAAVK